MKSFSVEKGTAGKGSGGKTTIIKQNQSGNSSGGNSYDVFQGASETNPGTSGLVPQPLAGQDTLFLKGNGIWDKVFQYIREDSDGNIYIDGKATKFGCPIYLNDIWSRDQDKENPQIEIHDNVIFDKDEKFLGDVSVGKDLTVVGNSSIGGNSDFLGEARFSDDVWFNRTNPKDGTTNKVTCNADLEVNGKSNFTDDMTATNITVDYLTVTKLAHFFELVIDKIRASQGQIIITDANAKVDHVETNSDKTKLYWRADSENQTNLALNEFVTGDQIVCQTFNRGQMEKDDDGSYHGYNVSNKYYWVVVSQVGQGEEYSFSDVDEGRKHVYNWIAVSNSDSTSPKDGAFLPEVGDEIVQLGNRTDETRQAAIVISAYNNTYLDKGIKAPAIVQYDGIDDFQLGNHRLNIISKGLNKFMGSYLTEDGQTNIVDKIGDVERTTTNKFSEIQQTIDGITQTVSNNTQEISETKKTLEDLKTSSSGDISGILGRLDGIDSSLGDYDVRITTNTENISKIDQKADQIKATVEKNTNSITDINSSIGDLSGKITENTKAISEIKQTAEEIDLSVKKNTERIEEVSKVADGALTDANISDLRQQVTTNTENIGKLTIKADNINSTVEEHETKITKIGTDLGTTNETVSSLTKTVTDNKSEIDQRADKIELNVSSNKTEIDELTGKVTNNTSSISTIKQTADSISTRVTTIEGDYVTSSQLTQTSTEILAEVSNTYLKIEDGKVTINAAVSEATGDFQDQINKIKKGEIELNGNTTISGDLTVKDSDNGFTLIGTNGNTQIKPKSVGSWFDYVSTPTNYWQQEGTSCGMTMYQSGNNYLEAFHADNRYTKQQINIENESVITFSGIGFAWTMSQTLYMGFYPNITVDENSHRVTVKTPDNKTTFIQFIYDPNFTVTWKIVDPDTNTVLTTSTDTNQWSYTPSTTKAAYLQAEVVVKVTKWEVWRTSWSYGGKNYTLSDASKVQTTNWVQPCLYCFITHASNSSLVQNTIGYDGQVYRFGTNGTVMFNSEGFQAKYGDYCFMINKNNLQSNGQYFPKGIWSINKQTFTSSSKFQGETAESGFITRGRGFGSLNLRGITSSGKIVVQPEDDIICIEWGVVQQNMNVEVYFGANNPDFAGHIIYLIHNNISRNYSSSMKICTTDYTYNAIYTSTGNTLSGAYNMSYETKKLIYLPDARWQIIN